MEILIKGQPALIKAGSSFDFVAENRFFTGSDSYTMNIEFPLAGCPQNLAIFGNLNITDVNVSDVVFDCELRSGAFYRSGIVTITEINETMVKTQFLEGRSSLNFKSSFDDIYINELSLGYPARNVSSYNGLPYDMNETGPYDFDNCTAMIERDKYVALPWVNNNSGNVQNDCIPNRYGQLYRKCKQYSFQPYLRYLTELILHRIGYTYDLYLWHHSRFNNIICCNALPAAWDILNFARALPHWTVTEYFEQLEKLLPGEFDIDHKAKHVRFNFNGNVINNIPAVKLDRVLDDFSIERTEEDESEYKFQKNVKYADCDHRMWKFYSCPWFPAQMSRDIVEYAYYSLMTDALANYRTFFNSQIAERPLLNKIFYVRAMGTYFILQIVERARVSGDYRYKTKLVPINQFGAKIVNKESEEYDEMGFVPVWFDETDKGNIMFLECNEYDEKLDEEETIDENFLLSRKTSTVTLLEEGERSGKAEYFDKIYFAYWQKERMEANLYYRPITDEYTMKSDGWTLYTDQGTCFRVNQDMGYDERDEVLFAKINRIDGRKKYTYKFLSDVLPNPRSVFYIHGGKYLCRKLTATFRESGMSQLIKGEFYKVL